MPTPDLFVGVVSHEGTRFAVSQSPEGLAARLAAQLPAVEVRVNTADLLDPASPRVSPQAVQATLSAELRLEREWARFLDRPTGPRWWAVHATRWVRRAWLRVRPPDPSMIRRLLNIEMSHLDLMRAGLESGARGVLILEDDAFCTQVDDLAAGLVGLLAADPQPSFVNLSESFTPRQLGIEHLLTPVGTRSWAGSQPRSLLQARRPVTNTVCAILYSSTFLAELVSALDELPVEPVVPIDWRLNEALMALQSSRRLTAACWMVEPAPIVQMSMRPDRGSTTG